ncbi:TetR family transcriptional regulator [Actinoallomurus sp. NBC_01490]|uniref:TetR/AcrR family transcriptional regulator n=1 Tax=Actinoallomurus sp. NBC_01490 TaxID=2903557 RepID=UPI002E32F1E6|nr:TetR family transcriptional regulator [Actinoallomurus sp. NBC_01490]
MAITRRERLADAAIDTLAREGLRGLTHRAVDRAAGVPEGSCSYYFRTRQALLAATVDRLAELDAAEIATLPVPSCRTEMGATGAVEALATMIERYVATGRTRMLARYELALEATRRGELRASLVAAGARFRVIAEGLLAAAGATEPARQAPIFVACLDGLIFDHLAGAGDLQLAPGELRVALLELLRAFAGPGGRGD